MPRFLIEVPHDSEPMACARAVELFLKTGNHFLTHADWGCYDGEHKAWIIAEVKTKDEARSILPPVLRPLGKIVRLNFFTLAQIEDFMMQHQAG